MNQDSLMSGHNHMMTILILTKEPVNSFHAKDLLRNKISEDAGHVGNICIHTENKEPDVKKNRGRPPSKQAKSLKFEDKTISSTQPWKVAYFNGIFKIKVSLQIKIEMFHLGSKKKKRTP